MGRCIGRGGPVADQQQRDAGRGRTRDGSQGKATVLKIRKLPPTAFHSQSLCFPSLSQSQGQGTLRLQSKKIGSGGQIPFKESDSLDISDVSVT
jgi:hypothetical protein